jgi:D-amino-acid dehydrogenase
MTAWRKRLHSLGVEVVENCELQRFDGSTAVTTQGAMPADAYVIAAGAWTAKLGAMLGVRVPILPGKGYSLTMTRPTICPTTPMIFEEDRVAVSPFADGLRIGSMMEFVGFNDTINPKRLKLLTDTAKRYLRDCDGTMQETWTGWRPMIYDGKPVIDFVPRRPNVLVAGGHGMLGLSMAPATGQLAAAMLSGTATAIDPAHYSLTRFA